MARKIYVALNQKCLAQSMFMAQYFSAINFVLSPLSCLCSRSIFMSTRIDLCWNWKFYFASTRRVESSQSLKVSWRDEAIYLRRNIIVCRSSLPCRQIYGFLFIFHFPHFPFSSVTFYSFRLHSHPPANCFGSSRNSLNSCVSSRFQSYTFCSFRIIFNNENRSRRLSSEF